MSKQELPSGRVVLYLGRQQLGLYDPRQNQVFGFEFPKEIVSDLTVLNDEEYKKLLSRALAQYKIAKQKACIVLARDIYFTKPIDETKSQSRAEVKTADVQLKEWQESAPFANVYARVVKQQNQSVGLVVGRDFFEPLLNSLNELGYEVTTLIPELVAPADFSSGLTVENGAVLSNSADKPSEYNFLESQAKAQAFTITSTTPEDKKRTWLLLVVFGVLLLLLAAVYWYVNIFSSSSPPPTPMVVPPTAPVPTALPVLTEPEVATTEAFMDPIPTELFLEEGILPEVATTSATP